MLDIKEIRKNPEEIEKRLKSKDPEASVAEALQLDKELRALKNEAETLKAERNANSKQIGEMKRRGEDGGELMEEAARISEKAQELDRRIAPLEKAFVKALAELPNLPTEDIRISQDPADNVLLREWGERPQFDFPFKNHLELNEKLKLFDFERGAKVSGTGWPAYRGMGARLEWALLQYMMECNIRNGFTPWLPPLLVREEILFGSGQLPKFADQQFRIKDDDYNLWLIPTSEVSLNGLHYDEILDEKELPKKYCAYTPCFRREAGAAGKQERGLIRMHQFNKVEMFCFSRPEESQKIFEEMLASAEEILKGLGLHFRSMLLVTGDMSFGSTRTVDVEAWLPGQERYYEVSSVSNCTDFQSRRSRIRYRPDGGKPELVHTLNGSGLATSRLMVALLENNQNADGTVNIPPVLQSYLGGIEKLG